MNTKNYSPLLYFPNILVHRAADSLYVMAGTLNSLISAVQLQAKRFNKIEERLTNKFKSNPAPTSGLLLRLKSDLDEVNEIRGMVKDLCAEITSRLDEVTDIEARKKFEDFVVNQPDNCQQSYAELIEKYENIRAKFEGKSKENTTVDPIVNDQGLKLKDIDVPEFSGNFREFMHYKGIFEVLVHNNKRYSNPEKMHYLTTSLKGDAKKVLSDTTDTAINLLYPDAWAAVCKWYENATMIINALFKDLFAIRKINHPSACRSLVLEVDSILRGLKVIGENPDEWGSILHYLVASKLDEETKKDWQKSRIYTTEYPKYAELKKFLLTRAQTCDYNTGTATPTKPKSNPSTQFSSPKEKHHELKKVFSISETNKCICCKKIPSHLLIECETFNSLKPKERYEVRRISAMRHCARIVSARNIKQEFVPNFHANCAKRDIILLLHFDTERSIETPSTSSVDKNSEPVSRAVNSVSEIKTVANVQKSKKFILLPTAVVQFNSGSIYGLMRVMFDCCSQSTAVVDTFVAKNKLKTCNSNIQLTGVGGCINSSFKCELTLMSRFSSFQLDIEADVVPQSAITYQIPADEFYLNLSELSKLQVAEKSLKYRSVDLILGNEYYHRCILGATRVFDGVIFQETRFGWTPTGPIQRKPSGNPSFSFTTTREIQKDLQKFWNLDEVVPNKPIEAEHDKCKRHFCETVNRADDGRFVVRLPLKKSPTLLGKSRSNALKSLIYSEKRQRLGASRTVCSFYERVPRAWSYDYDNRCS